MADLKLDYGQPARPTGEMVEELMHHLAVASQRDDIDCIVMRAAVGSDFGVPSHGEMPHVASLLEQMERISKPCVAAVSGYCADLGLALALACDVVVATRSSRFQLSLGPQADQVAGALAVRIGRVRANAMLISDSFIDGTAATNVGLAHQCVTDKQLDRHVQIQVTSIREALADCRRVLGQD
ncbi:MULTISPECIES: enoyl-CoA hydratase-related protein [unclassified Mycolicibacterium]|uniref:enoyl-CoA hydratase-related protein n=1 Tax=unclassified Mycolicibacterium TaxID=2636767 RepID=UPI001F4C3F43|nr:enoyl-CoA hydratase-related protein [Mycolicibacterium sp. YH-1]UNB52147.1 enoyl-CoA hydratase-related protein [Mycolicibacterium sp. YH-1]